MDPKNKSLAHIGLRYEPLLAKKGGNNMRRKWLSELRLQKKFSIRGIAPIFDISWQYYSDIESGRRNPSIELSLKMADFFEVPVEKFFENRISFKKEKKAQ